MKAAPAAPAPTNTPPTLVSSALPATPAPFTTNEFETPPAAPSVSVWPVRFHRDAVALPPQTVTWLFVVPAPMVAAAVLATWPPLVSTSALPVAPLVPMISAPANSRAPLSTVTRLPVAAPLPMTTPAAFVHSELPPVTRIVWLLNPLPTWYEYPLTFWLASNVPLLTVTEFVPSAARLPTVSVPPRPLTNTGPTNVFEPCRIRLNRPTMFNGPAPVI